MTVPAAQPSAVGILTTRIGRRFLGLFAGCALLPLVVFAWIAVARTTEQMRRETIAALHNGAKTAGMGIAARLSQIAGDLALARDVASQPAGPPRDAAAITLREHVGARCATVWVADGASVRLLCGDRPVDLGPRQDAELAQLAAGKPVVCALGEPPRLVMFQALDAARPDGPLVAASIRGERFWDAEELQGPGCEFGAFDSMWRPLFHTFPAAPDTRQFAIAAIAAGSSGTIEWTPDGTPHLSRYWRAFLKPQYLFDLYVVQSRPQAEALAVSHEFTQWFFTTAFGTMLLVVLASLVQLRRTLDPIGSLRDATRRVAAGDMDARVAIRSADEFGELGNAFNEMAARLQENVRKREITEGELVASRDAALAAATAKAEFVSNVSHELRTPMTEILSAVEIVSDLGESELAVREEFSRIALQGAQRLARLIDDVLELGDTEVWKMAPVDVAATVEAAVAALPADVRARVRLDAAGDLPFVVGSAERLVETWGRLLDNAAKFSDLGSPIDARVGAHGRDVVVELSDRGVGIAVADLPRLFEPFCQLGRDQLTEKAQGAGLGLTLAKHAIDRHGGRIEVDSEPGRGTTFRIALPAATELPAARV